MAEAAESVRDSLNAAFDAAERVAPPEPRSSPAESRTNGAESRTVERESRTNGHEPPRESRSNGEEPTESPELFTESQDERDEPRESSVDRPRDQFGRFMRSTPPASPTSEQQPSGAPTGDEGEEEEITDQPEPRGEEPARPAILPPQAWSAAARESWGKLPRAIQEEVDRRERDVQRAFQQRAEQANVLEPLAQALQPYAQQLHLKGVHPAQAVTQLLAVQNLLDNDPIAGVAHVAKLYGVDLRQFAAAYTQAQQPQDPAVRELATKVQQQEQMLRQWQQGAEMQEQNRITDEVQRFAADTQNHPYFEYVRQRMGEFMASGVAPTLDEAYRMACAVDPRVSAAIRQSELEAERAQRSAQDRQAAVRARRTGVSVTGAPGGMAQPPKGKADTVRDAVRSAMEELGV